MRALLALGLSSLASSALAEPLSVEMIVEEALPPFPSWGNLVATYGAAGDGNSDDTAAIQHCLDDISHRLQQTCYFPAGVYKITSTLHLDNIQGKYTGRLIGAHPDTTKILWAGPTDGTMLLQNGGAGADYERITWDGGAKAKIGVAHWWNRGGKAFYQGGAQHQDEVFENMAIGINAGRFGRYYGDGDSEGQIRRVSFINNTFAGLDTGSFNALDWWVWESSFVHCARGFSNNYAIGDAGETKGAGNAHIYRSNFSGSTVADFDIGNTGGFTLSHNVSTGAAKFLQAGFAGENDALIVVQGNRVVNLPSKTTPIEIGDSGPLVLIDNEFANRSSPLFAMIDRPGLTDGDALAIGNATYGTLPVAKHKQRIVSIDNNVAQPGAISTSPLNQPPTPDFVSHEVFEVPPAASATEIQAAIDKAVASADPQAIVHFGGVHKWSVAKTLTIPAYSHVQLVGDGLDSILQWTGKTGPLIQISCPAKVTVRDVSMHGAPTATPLSASGCDSEGGRFQVVGSWLGGLSASNLTHTRVTLQANSGIMNGKIDPTKTSVNLVNDTNVVSIGSGNFGAVSMSGADSRFVLENIWTETVGSGNAPAIPLFNIADGEFTLLGGFVAAGSHGGAGLQKKPPITVSGSKAKQSFIAVTLPLVGVADHIGVQVENEDPEMKAYFFANTTFPGDHDWFKRQGPAAGTVSFVLNRQNTGQRDGGPGQLPDLGDTSSASILAGFAQARALEWDVAPYVPPPGATDIKIYRVVAIDMGAVVITN